MLPGNKTTICKVFSIVCFFTCACHHPNFIRVSGYDMIVRWPRMVVGDYMSITYGVTWLNILVARL